MRPKSYRKRTRSPLAQVPTLKNLIKEMNEDATKNDEIDVHVNLQQEIERLKSELLFVNEEKRKLEEATQTEDKKSMLEKGPLRKPVLGVSI